MSTQGFHTFPFFVLFMYDFVKVGALRLKEVDMLVSWTPLADDNLDVNVRWRTTQKWFS